jgi:hypothetical protein
MKELVKLIYFAGVRLPTLVCNFRVDNEDVFEELHLLEYNVSYSPEVKLPFLAGFLFGVYFNPEDGGYMFVRNVG